MGAFAPGEPGALPPDLPIVEIPAPSFSESGKQAAAGVMSAGWWKACWSAFWEFALSGWVKILTWTLSAMTSIALHGAKIIDQAETANAPEFQRLVNAGISDLFGVDVGVSTERGAAGRGSRRAAAKTIGEAMLTGLFGSFSGAGAQQLTPSSKGAEDYLTTVGTLAIEGWLAGFTAELISLGAIETYGELDDIVAEVLGLGRLTRRVLGPPVSILVETPFEWQLNRTYRPKLLSSSQTARQFARGRWTREQVDEELARQGYSKERIDALLAVDAKYLSDTDLSYLVARGTWTREQAIAHLKEQGWTADMAAALLAIADDRRLDTYRRQYASVAGDAFARGDIDDVEYRQILDDSGLPEEERHWNHLVDGLRRELRRRELSLSQLEDGVKRGILNINDFRARVLDMGYSFEDEQTLELLVLTEISESEAAKAERERIAAEREAEKAERLAAAEQRRLEAEARLAVRGLSLSQFERLVRGGLRTVEEYRSFLTSEKFTAADVAALAELMTADLEARDADEARRAELAGQAEVRRVSLADLEDAVKRGLRTIEEYKQSLAELGFAEVDRDLLARLLQAAIDDAAAKAEQRTAAEAAAAVRGVSLAKLELATRRGLRAVDDYRGALLAQGFTAGDTDLLVSLVELQIADDDVARVKREEAAETLRPRLISLSDLEAAVRAGIRTVADYRATLAAQGFTAADQDTLARLLEYEIEQDRLAQEVHDQAEAALAPRRISLSALERAVKLDVVPITRYQAMLIEQGFAAEDADILTLSLEAELAAVLEAKEQRAAAETEVDPRGLSLAQFERAVRAGLRGIGEYESYLLGLRFDDAAVQTLVGLLNLELQQDQDARDKRSQVDADLRSRGLSLSQFEESVKTGLQTLPAYETWLLGLGYSLDDVAVLVALLQFELEGETAGA
jgi:hypothetical protein